MCRKETGFHIDFQLKACKNVVVTADTAKYDLNVDTYNYLVSRHEARYTNKVLLILLALHEVEAEWLSLSEEQLVLKKCCYWISLVGRERQCGDSPRDDSASKPAHRRKAQ